MKVNGIGNRILYYCRSFHLYSLHTRSSNTERKYRNMCWSDGLEKNLNLAKFQHHQRPFSAVVKICILLDRDSRASSQRRKTREKESSVTQRGKASKLYSRSFILPDLKPPSDLKPGGLRRALPSPKFEATGWTLCSCPL